MHEGRKEMLCCISRSRSVGPLCVSVSVFWQLNEKFDLDVWLYVQGVVRSKNVGCTYMASAGAPAYNGGLGWSPQRGPWTEPQV